MAKKLKTDEQRARALERSRRHLAKPETKAKRAEYYLRPEVQARYKLRNGSDAWKEYCKQYRKTDKGIRSMKDSGLKKSTDGAFTLELWETLAKLQGGACAICRRGFDSLGYRNVHADHCHEELKPRGLLCRNCNHAEGQIRKTGLSPDEFGRRMALYLQEPPAQRVVETVAGIA